MGIREVVSPSLAKHENVDEIDHDKKWYLIQCKSGQEDRALLHLENQSFQCYKPELKIEKINKGKLAEVQGALFPGYIFILLDKVHCNWRGIRSTRGVLRLVAFGNELASVDQGVIERLQLNDGNSLQSQFKKGDSVNIADGPFAQLEAIYDEMDGERRAIVLLNLMSKWHRVKLPLEQLSDLT